MIKNKKRVTAIIIIVILIVVIIFQADNLKHNIRQISKPTIESRKLSRLGIYKVMTVKGLSKRYKVQQNEVFKLLEITPEKGDENLSLMELQKKYGKTHEEMKKNVKRLLEHKNSKGKKL